MDDDTRLYRYRCSSCGYEDYVGVSVDCAAQAIRRRCAREFRLHADRGRKRFDPAGAVGF